MGIHVFKVCSCILDQTNQEAIQNAESVSMGARLAQQCLPAPERHCVVLVGKKQWRRLKGEGQHAAGSCRAGAALLQGSPVLCCISVPFPLRIPFLRWSDSPVLIPAQPPELRAESGRSCSCEQVFSLLILYVFLSRTSLRQKSSSSGLVKQHFVPVFFSVILIVSGYQIMTTCK